MSKFRIGVIGFVLLVPLTAFGKSHKGDDKDREHRGHEPAKTLYVWAGDQARVAPDFLDLSADHNILACGGLLSLLRGQNGIFFFDVSDARHPKFLFSTSAPQSSITDAFLPLEAGGFLVTQMGSASGGAPGRLAEFDAGLHLDQGVAGQSSAGRIQPPRPLRAPRAQPDGDF